MQMPDIAAKAVQRIGKILKMDSSYPYYGGFDHQFACKTKDDLRNLPKQPSKLSQMTQFVLLLLIEAI